MIRFQTIEPKVAHKIVAHQRPTKTIVERLADAICEIAGEQRPITTQALLDYGFSKPVIERCANQARGIARRRFTKKI